jgi:hypothetical protein
VAGLLSRRSRTQIQTKKRVVNPDLIMLYPVLLGQRPTGSDREVEQGAAWQYAIGSVARRRRRTLYRLQPRLRGLGGNRADTLHLAGEPACTKRGSRDGSQRGRRQHAWNVRAARLRLPETSCRLGAQSLAQRGGGS